MSTERETNAYRRLIEIGIALSSETELESLLTHILREAKSLAHADAGTIYLGNDHSLRFSIVLNDSLGISQDENTQDPIDFPEIPLNLDDGKPNLSNVASYALHRGIPVAVANAAESGDFDFSDTRAIDRLLDYKSVSFLTVPLKASAEHGIGVLQLVNAKDDDGAFIPFQEEIIPLIEALASQASVLIENRQLLDEQHTLKKQLEREVDARTKELKDALMKLSEAHIVLKELNTIDAVTGIRNRQYFDDVLDQEWRRAKRQGYDLSLMLLDIDHFKKVNDTYGHLVGDECLARVAKAVDSMFNRPSDVVARYGGEEFAVILPYVSSDNALRLAENLRKSLEQTSFEADGHTLSVTMSIGVATVAPHDDVEPRDLVAWADSVLYKAKSNGRNQVRGHPG